MSVELNIQTGERVGLFIDGSNLYAAARALGFDIDYKRLLDVFQKEGRLIRAFYYTALVENEERLRQAVRQIGNCLRQQG